jgi:DNA-nicking Smr family endonuclease
MAPDGRSDGDPRAFPDEGTGDDLTGLDDEAAWEHAMRDVRPLADREQASPDLQEEAPTAGLAERFRMRREAVPTVTGDTSFAFDRRTAERFRRGQVAIEATLDLHGYTQEEAFAAVDAFLEESFQEGRRCVLVVTGKGTARDGGGVLRSSVPRWITEGVHRGRLIGLGPAESQHGGDGAIYVLLRRPERESQNTR